MTKRFADGSPKSESVPTFHRVIAETTDLMPDLVLVWASYLSRFDQLMLRRLGIRLGNGQLLYHGGPALRDELPTRPDNTDICRRPHCLAKCGMTEERIRNQHPPLVECHKRLEVQQVANYGHKSATIPQDRYDYHQMPVVTLCFQPKYKRGDSDTLYYRSEDYLFDAAYLFTCNKTVHQDIYLMDMDTTERLVNGVGSTVMGHNHPVGEVPCGTVIRYIVSFREYDPETKWLRLDADHVQCRACQTQECSIHALDWWSPVEREFRDNEYLESHFGLDVAIEMKNGTTYLTTGA